MAALGRTARTDRTNTRSPILGALAADRLRQIKERGMSKHYRRQNRIDGQFIPHLVEMVQSPAWSILSRTARQVLDCIEIELARHGGKDNGELIVTYDQFVAYGIHRQAIAPAIRELIALGFLEVTEPGRAGNADFRRPSKYRVTYRETNDAPPTHEWRPITKDHATMIAKGARRPGTNSAAPKKQNSSDGKRTEPSGGNRHRNPVTETVLLSDGNRTENPVTETVLLSRYLPIYPAGDCASSRPADEPRQPAAQPQNNDPC
jgi:hypothetical protein